MGVVPANSPLHSMLAPPQLPDLPKTTQKLCIPTRSLPLHPPGAVGAVVLPRCKIPLKPAVLRKVGGCKVVKQFHLQGTGEVAVGAGGQHRSYPSQSGLWWAPAHTAQAQLPPLTSKQISGKDTEQQNKNKD